MNSDVWEELIDYGEMEGSELGDAVLMLNEMSRYYYIFSEEFQKQMEVEAKRLLVMFKTEFKIVEEEITRSHTYTEVRLEMIDE